MDASSFFTLKPIGYMKSIFHFKNGTPRQSSLCQNARGILTIEKSVFNNPEHSLECLQQFSHAWILFVFHKNNNAHTKAKVKPPRLNGQRVGVFSTRSPYRPNNIGLSLAKIDRIQGASIHFSGIDILDGTPIVDIKPYIPEYDTPAPESEWSSRVESSHNSRIPTATTEHTSTEVIDRSTSFLEQTTQDLQIAIEDLSLGRNKMCKDFHNNDDSPDIKGSKKVMVDGDKALTNPEPPVSSDGVKEGFYSLSAALDKARSKLETVCDNGKGYARLSCSHTDTESRNISDAVSSVMGPEFGREKCEDDEDTDLNSLVGDVICRAASDIYSSSLTLIRKESIPHSFPDNMKDNSPVAHTRDITDTDLKPKNILAVTAPWLSSPPVNKIDVKFSVESLQQLEAFHSDAKDSRYRSELLSGPDDAKKAITSILHQEPRSVYRRQRCQNSVYFFAVDVLHVTCWFDGDLVTVLRIKPAADVPQLQEKKSCRDDDNNIS